MIYGAGASRPRGILSPRKKSQEITTGARRPRPIAFNAKRGGACREVPPRFMGCRVGLSRPILFDYFYDLVALTHDVKTVCGVLYAYALEVVVFNGSILVDFDTFNTSCATVKGNDIVA